MPKKVIGLDPGKYSLKAVEIERGFRSHEVMRRFQIDRSAENGDLSSMVKQVFGEGRVEADVWTSFPLAEVTSRLIRVPFASYSKLERVIPFELEGSVPFGAEEMIVDHHTVDQQKSSSWVLAAGAKRERLGEFLGQLTGAGLNPRGLVPEGYAYRSLAAIIQPEPNAPYAFLDIGASHSIFIVGLGDRVVAGRSISVAGDDITRILCQKLSLEPQFAEKQKLLGANFSTLTDATREALGPLAVQVRNSLRYLRAEEGVSPAKIYLCGGTARIQKIDSLLSEMIGLPCEVPELPGGPTAELGPEDAHALALALEDISAVHGVNFRKAEFSYRSEATVLREKLLFPSILVILLIVFFNINSFFGNRIRQAQSAELAARITNVVQIVMPEENLKPALAAKKLRSEIERLKKLEETLGKLSGLTPLEFLTALSDLIPPDLKMDVEQVTMTDKVITMDGVIPEHSDMDIILEKLKTFKSFKRFDTPTLKPKVGGGVRFNMRIFLTEEESEGGQ